ncbi:hypothetical protein [Streptococcus suis]|nr:hypothetical protein [Streptococcus suis]
MKEHYVENQLSQTLIQLLQEIKTTSRTGGLFCGYKPLVPARAKGPLK